jgi:hypothetical protein
MCFKCRHVLLQYRSIAHELPGIGNRQYSIAIDIASFNGEQRPPSKANDAGYNTQRRG